MVGDSIYVDMVGNKLFDLKIEIIKLNMNISIWVNFYYCFIKLIVVERDIMIMCIIKLNFSFSKKNYWEKNLDWYLCFL